MNVRSETINNLSLVFLEVHPSIQVRAGNPISRIRVGYLQQSRIQREKAAVTPEGAPESSRTGVNRRSRKDDPECQRWKRPGVQGPGEGSQADPVAPAGVRVGKERRGTEDGTTNGSGKKPQVI